MWRADGDIRMRFECFGVGTRGELQSASVPLSISQSTSFNLAQSRAGAPSVARLSTRSVAPQPLVASPSATHLPARLARVVLKKSLCGSARWRSSSTPRACATAQVRHEV